MLEVTAQDVHNELKASEATTKKIVKNQTLTSRSRYLTNVAGNQLSNFSQDFLISTGMYRCTGSVVRKMW
jgi:hypothetical protein